MVVQTCTGEETEARGWQATVMQLEWHKRMQGWSPKYWFLVLTLPLPLCDLQASQPGSCVPESEDSISRAAALQGA